MLKRPLIVFLYLASLVLSPVSVVHAADDLFRDENLVAWCIVPFDSKKRGPEDRAAMLEKLGFSKFAYDYRAEHIPTFDAEIEALKRHNVELTAWWFPTVLNDEAKMTLEVFKKHKVTPQLWVTGGGGPTATPQEQRQRVIDEAARIRPIALAAEQAGCKVALYNHGGWFGQPENQIAIIKELELPNVGIVYNQHHGHEHLDRFPQLLKAMLPYLYTLNLNGMVIDGDKKGQKIIQLGQGDLDLALLKVIRDSGYKGPIGILGHTDDDAEERLHDNLDGLHWLKPQLAGKPAGPKPVPRTPVPVPQAALPRVTPADRLTAGKFGRAFNAAGGGVSVAAQEGFRQFPLTVECWTQLTDKGPYNILVAHEDKSSGTHWELFSMAGNGHLTVYTPGFTPDHCHSTANICDGKWHHVAMVLEADRIRLFVDARQVASQPVQRTDRQTVPGGLAIGSLVDQGIGCSGLIDEVRISRGVRTFEASPSGPFEVDETTLGLWHFDELKDEKHFDDATGKSTASVTQAAAAAGSPSKKKDRIEGHWGEDALGFRWTEEDSRDDRFGQMDTGPFFSGSITGPGGTVYKGIVVRVGPEQTDAVLYDTELMRASAGWKGFIRFDAARFGIIVPPRIEGDVTFTNPLLAGVSRDGQFTNHRKENPYGPLPKTEAHYEGLYRHEQRVILKFTIGTKETSKAGSQAPTVLLESPWRESAEGISALSRTISIGPSDTPISILAADGSARVRLIKSKENATLTRGPDGAHVLTVAPHAGQVLVKLLIGSPASDEVAFERLAASSSAAEDLAKLMTPGPTIWGEPLVTVGEVAKDTAPYVIDTITVPFENRFNALMFCGGHDFLPDGRAVVCTLHGDVWLVDGIDDKLEKITWRRFATGLFQPLGVKVIHRKKGTGKSASPSEIYVVGRDQITRLYDINNDGEADYYENFNNDAYVSLNGHEYVACLETDRAGNFYYVKGNCNSAIPHDGSLLRVSADGQKLDVYATGFRNPNGMSIGPQDEITVAPQEGEWTPASAVFDVHQGGFYGGMMSHHQATPPTDFERPFCWFPRLADNSCGSQVWVTSDRWGPLSNQLLHLSYGQCELRLLLREKLVRTPETQAVTGPAGPYAGPLMNGGSTEFNLQFASGVHRGKFHEKDGQLYLTGLKGWVSSAVNDGCFQRVRYTGQGVDLLVGMKTYRNGISLTFSRELLRSDAEDIDNYDLEAWNYRWSAEYGSPDLKPSAPGQIGRDVVEPRSATLLPDGRTVFIEIPDLKPVDQIGISYLLRSTDKTTFEQTAYLTLNGLPGDVFPEDQLHRTTLDPEKEALLARLQPGVLLAGSSLPHPVIRRQLAWSGIAPSLNSEPVTISGYLKVPFTGDFRFSVRARVRDDASSDTEDTGAELAHSQTILEINGEQQRIGPTPITFRLRKGLNSIGISHVPTITSPHFGLMWESDRFPKELIPATLLFHDSAQDADPRDTTADSGRLLYEKHQCARCHIENVESSASFPTGLTVEQIRLAPRLDGIGSRLQPGWLNEWLRHPAHVRPDATMPRLLGKTDDQAVADLVAYLTSIPDSELSPAGSQEPADVTDAIEKGAVLYERLGCIACHTFTRSDENAEWDRVSLHFVKSKFKPGQLQRFLAAPHRNHTTSRMPDFHLTPEEVVALSAYLEHSSTGMVPASANPLQGDVKRGHKRFLELRCHHCHQTKETDQLAPPDVRSLFMGTATKGCLQTEATGPHRITYDLNDDDRSSLGQYLKSGRTPVNSTPEDSGRLQQILTSLRCSACHSRDSASSLWPEIIAEEGSGQSPEAVPHLTWVGEKLQGPWTAQFLAGNIKQKPRPWLRARMPSFPAYANLIAHELASEHGVAFEEPVPTELTSAKVEQGRLLTLRDGGLDCRQCHAVGKDVPRGDKATQIALGINFAFAKDRLRPEFALRQMLDPPRYDMGSRMPRFAPDLKTTAATQVEGGNARRQFEAIKQYLWSIRTDE
ncbi:DUF6797 domain-containing protein [Schlesneria sp. T3-172]|uniref:DUF6797 domain-containing protein n=2 Tax=Schlesneria TaxID=656899 RepID=UPI0037CC4BE4